MNIFFAVCICAELALELLACLGPPLLWWGAPFLSVLGVPSFPLACGPSFFLVADPLFVARLCSVI